MALLRALAQSLSRKEILIPALQKFLAKEHADRQSGKISKKDIRRKECEITIKASKEMIAEFNHEEDLKGDYFHPSALGVCLRRLFFGAKHAPINDGKAGSDYLKEQIIFDFGSSIHTVIQNLCERAGYLEKREVALKSEKFRLLGHGDGLLRIKGRKYLLEIKTINARQFAQLVAPKEEHKKQVHAYMRALKLDCAIILYIEKDRAQLKEFVVHFEMDYYRKEVKWRIQRYFHYVKENQLPKREGDNPNRFPCMFCEFSRICFDTRALAKWLGANSITHSNEKTIKGAPKQSLAEKVKEARKAPRKACRPSKTPRDRKTLLHRFAALS